MIFCDNAATTPVHPAVAAAVSEAVAEVWGNPSSVHAKGREARRRVEAARRQVAALLHALPSEIVFTSGGTEADNLALFGAVPPGGHLVTSAVEHHAVLDACDALQRAGCAVTVVAVDRLGRVDPADVEAALRPDTALVSLMLANNEVGTLQPVAEVAARVRARNPRVRVHTDAVAACGRIPVDVDALGVDLATVSAHKIYGPKGAGALYVRRGTHLEPRQHGGSQERRWRPGTENVPGIVGFGVAAELAARELPERARHLRELSDRLRRQIAGEPTGDPDPEGRSPGLCSFVFPPALDGEALLVKLDLEGVCASSGSACTSGAVEPSHVLLACGHPRDVALTALRLSLGAGNTAAEVDAAARIVNAAVAELRSRALAR